MDPEQLPPALERIRVNLSGHRHLPNENPNPHLRPLNSTVFKREESLEWKRRRERRRLEKEDRRKRREVSRLEKQFQQLCSPPPGSELLDLASSDIPWPCDHTPSPKPPPASTGWGDSWSPAPAATSPTLPFAEGQALAAADQAQRNGLRASLSFFTNNEDDDEDEVEGDEMGRTSLFFTDLFNKDEDLRAHYKNNWAKGAFYCLVCCGIGEKVRRRYVNCAGMVQHANSISNTKRRLAHREFARVICWLLDWDTCGQDYPFINLNVVFRKQSDDQLKEDQSEELVLNLQSSSSYEATLDFEEEGAA